MTSWRLFKEDFTVLNSSIKPTLTEENKNQRAIYCLNFVDLRSIITRQNEHEWQFHDMIHINEKWLLLTKCRHKYTSLKRVMSRDNFTRFSDLQKNNHGGLRRME